MDGGSAKRALLNWPVLRQLTGPDPLARGSASRSEATSAKVARTETADRVVDSVCPYCAVGCAQKVYVKDEKVIQIEGDAASPISRGRLCPKGSASEQYVNSPGRQTAMLYRRPGRHPVGADGARNGHRHDRWTAFSTPARAPGRSRTPRGVSCNRTLGLGRPRCGATLDNEENYLIKKLFTALGAVQIENQARI